MFDGLLVHPESSIHLEKFIQAPSHALLIEGPANIGKSLIARVLASKLLRSRPEDIEHHPSCLLLNAGDKDKKVGIEHIREIGAFITLKMPGNAAIRRIVIIDDADKLQAPAQNALLKMLEEPPADTLFLLTSSYSHKLLPTVLSRLRRIAIKKPSGEMVADFVGKKYPGSGVEEAMTIGEGKIGAVINLVSRTEETPGFTIADIRKILQLDLFEQLLLIESELKDKTAAKEFVDLLSRIAAKSLLKVSGTGAAEQWQRISKASYVAHDSLEKNANPKLVLTELMLALR